MVIAPTSTEVLQDLETPTSPSKVEDKIADKAADIICDEEARVVATET